MRGGYRRSGTPPRGCAAAQEAGLQQPPWGGAGAAIQESAWLPAASLPLQWLMS
jgi:hypothetical protein